MAPADREYCPRQDPFPQSWCGPSDQKFEARFSLRAPKKMKRMERRSHAHAMDESPVWRISHGQATCQRRTLATHRTALASTQASSLPVPRCKPLDYRKVLTGIIFVLKTGIPWEELPQEMGCGCGMTCLNYLNAWQRAGVWEKLHQILLAEARAGRQARLVLRRGR